LVAVAGAGVLACDGQRGPRSARYPVHRKQTDEQFETLERRARELEARLEEVELELDRIKRVGVPPTGGPSRTLGRAQIAGGLGQIRDRIAACGDGRFAGTVTVKLEVMPDGHPFNIAVQDNPDPRIAACVAAAVAVARFDVTAEGGAFTAPFQFQAGR
jgi:hypothetical protein